MFKSTTVLVVKRGNSIVMGGDGQVTFGDAILKSNALKVRKIYNEQILAGFAGATSDAFALFSRLEAKLKEFGGNLKRAVVELSKDWRMDKYLRRLEALLLVANKDHIFLVSGTGDIIEPEDNIIAIGSGANYAIASAKALVRHTNLSAREIVEESLKIASEICIYTNDKIIMEEING